MLLKISAFLLDYLLLLLFSYQSQSHCSANAQNLFNSYFFLLYDFCWTSFVMMFVHEKINNWFQKQNNLIHKLSNRHIDTDQSTKNFFLCVAYLFNAFDGCTMHNQAAFLKKQQTKMIDKFKRTLQWSQFILNLNKHSKSKEIISIIIFISVFLSVFFIFVKLYQKHDVIVIKQNRTHSSAYKSG